MTIKTVIILCNKHNDDDYHKEERRQVERCISISGIHRNLTKGYRACLLEDAITIDLEGVFLSVEAARILSHLSGVFAPLAVFRWQQGRA